MANGMVIIGAGECGVRAAFALRENGYEGPVILIGTESHLPYERPPLSKDAMVSDDHPLPRTIAGEHQFTEKRIEFIGNSTVAAIDRDAKRITLDDGCSVPYERLLIATGALPRALPLAAGSKHCVTLRSYDDALRIRARFKPGAAIAIVGGGFIGLELAASARRRGASVTVIEAQPRIMMRG